MIYAISEDNFFTIGLAFTLSEVNIEVTHISIYDFSKITVKKDDIVLLCAHSRTHNQMLSQIVAKTIARVIYFVDADLEKHGFILNCRGVISKRLAQKELVDLLHSLIRHERTIITISLSKNEVMVMNMLVQEKNAHLIAKILKISAKTVFAHKLNALSKMGFKHLNSRSVLLYESVYQTRV